MSVSDEEHILVNHGWQPAPHSHVDGRKRWVRGPDMMTIGLVNTIDGVQKPVKANVRLYLRNQLPRHFDTLEEAVAASAPKQTSRRKFRWLRKEL